MLDSPKTTYSGLTVIIDCPSRFDFNGLLSGYAGQFFDNALLADVKYGVHRGSIEVRTLDTNAPLRYGTKTLLLLGEKSLAKYKPGVTLNEQRGSPFIVDGLTCIASYTPQDAFDRKNYFAAEQDSDTDSDK